MDFKILSGISSIENIAVDTGIRDLQRLKKNYGEGRWRKVKGIAKIQLDNGYITFAEIHWYEAHGRGQYEFKIKQFLDIEDD